MARAENQGLQIALIVFVMLTIVLAVVTFMYVRSFQEARAEATKLKDTARDDNARALDMQKEITLLKEMLGVDPKTIVGATEADEKAALTVKKTFETDMQQFAATLPPEKQHYRDALESIWQTNQELFTASTELQNNFKQLQDQFTRREEERDKQIKEFRDKADEQAKDTVDQRGKFEEDRSKVNATSEDLNTRLAQKDAEKGQVADAAAKQEQVFKGEIKTLSTDNMLKNEKLRKLQTSQFEVAQGEVVMVNPHKKGTVYLNLGSADQLIPLVTFSVHDAGANTAQGDGLKGAHRSHADPGRSHVDVPRAGGRPGEPHLAIRQGFHAAVASRAAHALWNLRQYRPRRRRRGRSRAGPRHDHLGRRRDRRRDGRPRQDHRQHRHQHALSTGRKDSQGSQRRRWRCHADQQSRVGRHRTHADDQVHRAVGLEGSAASREVRSQWHPRAHPYRPEGHGEEDGHLQRSGQLRQAPPMATAATGGHGQKYSLPRLASADFLSLRYGEVACYASRRERLMPLGGFHCRWRCMTCDGRSGACPFGAKNSTITAPIATITRPAKNSGLTSFHEPAM